MFETFNDITKRDPSARKATFQLSRC